MEQLPQAIDQAVAALAARLPRLMHSAFDLHHIGLQERHGPSALVRAVAPCHRIEVRVGFTPEESAGLPRLPTPTPAAPN